MCKRRGQAWKPKAAKTGKVSDAKLEHEVQGLLDLHFPSCPVTLHSECSDSAVRTTTVMLTRYRSQVMGTRVHSVAFVIASAFAQALFDAAATIARVQPSASQSHSVSSTPTSAAEVAKMSMQCNRSLREVCSGLSQILTPT